MSENVIPFRQRHPPTGAQHGLVCANIVYELKRYLLDHPIGICFGAGTGFMVHSSPPRVVALDAAIVRKERMPEDGVGLDALAGAPDLAVLVIAPTDKFDDVEADIHELMNAGTSHVWILRPRVRMVTVHRSHNDIAIMGETETLVAEDILPGLHLPVHRLFD